MVLPGLRLVLTEPGSFAWRTASQTLRWWGLWQGKSWLKTASQGADWQNSQADWQNRQEKESQIHCLEGKGREIFIYKEARLSEAWGKVMRVEKRWVIRIRCRCVRVTCFFMGCMFKNEGALARSEDGCFGPLTSKSHSSDNCAGPVLVSVVPTCFSQSD